MLEELKKTGLKIGFKEVMSLISENRAEKVFVADDCEDGFKNKITEAARSHGVMTESVSSMKELGKMCGIDVGASCAAVVK